MQNLEVIGKGATTKVYRDGHVAIKLYENASPDYADQEALHQRFAYDAGLPVPAVYGVRRLADNAVALDMAYIDGTPLLRPGMEIEDYKAAMAAFVALQSDVHKVRAIGLPKLTDCLSRKIMTAQNLDEPLRGDLLTLLARLDSASHCLCHGDFHPLNILFDGTKYWIIDWVDATAGDPLADACRTYLIFLQHMNRSAHDYLSAFCEASGAAQHDILAWLPIIAAARMRENMDDASRQWLLDIIRTWHR